MVQPSTGAPWMGLLIWVAMAVICGALLQAQFTARGPKREKLTRFVAYGVGTLFVIALGKVLIATGSLQAVAGVALVLGAMCLGIWRLYLRVFRSVLS